MLCGLVPRPQNTINGYTTVSRLSAYGWSTLEVCQTEGVGAVLSVSAFNHERALMFTAT